MALELHSPGKILTAMTVSAFRVRYSGCISTIHPSLCGTRSIGDIMIGDTRPRDREPLLRTRLRLKHCSEQFALQVTRTANLDSRASRRSCRIVAKQNGLPFSVIIGRLTFFQLLRLHNDHCSSDSSTIEQLRGDDCDGKNLRIA